MEILLLSDINGIGKKNDVLVVGNGYALNHLLPARKAIVVTPQVRKRYAEQIKQRALEREREKLSQIESIAMLGGKVVKFASKMAKTGKLYASINARDIASALKAQHGLTVKEDSIKMDEPIKSTGSHSVKVNVGNQSVMLTVEVKEAKEAKKAA